MIKFLITAAFVLVFVFILFLLLSLMAWSCAPCSRISSRERQVRHNVASSC